MLAHPELCWCLSWHPGRSSWLHSTTWQCLCMNIKASVGQWLIADLFLLKLILTPPVSHFHPPLNEHFFTTTALDTNYPTENPRDYRENTCGILECVSKDSIASLQLTAKDSIFPCIKALVIIFSSPAKKKKIGLGVTGFGGNTSLTSSAHLKQQCY